MMHRYFRVAFGSCVCGVALVLAGCGGSGKNVEGGGPAKDTGPTGVLVGKVTFNGKPVGVGEVYLMARGAPNRSGAINADGTYRVDPAPAGPVSIYLRFPVLPGVTIDPKSGKVEMKLDGPFPFPDEQKDAVIAVQSVPPKYCDNEKPLFHIKVKEGGETSFDIKLVK